MWKPGIMMVRMLVAVSPAAAQPVINEIMVANESAAADPQGEYDDWIELYNPAEQPLNFAGFFLSDDMSQQRSWRIPLDRPEDTTVSPRGYLLIWADGDVGVYVLMEEMQVSPNLVTIAELRSGDVDEPEITGGYVIKKDKDPTYEDLHSIAQSGQDLIYADPKGSDLSPVRRDWIAEYLDRFEAALYGLEFADLQRGYAAFVDVNSWVDLHLLVELTKNIDGYRLSNYITKDREGRLVAAPPGTTT